LIKSGAGLHQLWRNRHVPCHVWLVWKGFPCEIAENEH
jgi:hypothetical protein